MFLISGPELVIAACKAGVVGSFPTPNCRTPAELDAWMTQIVAGIAGAIAAGADFAYIGTRFLPTAESRAVEPYKQMIVDCGPDDLIVSAAITGTAASWLKPSLIACGYDIAALDGKAVRDYTPDTAHKRWRDTWAAGQGLHASKGIEPLSAVVDALELDYRKAVTRFQSRV